MRLLDKTFIKRLDKIKVCKFSIKKKSAWIFKYAVIRFAFCVADEQFIFGTGDGNVCDAALLFHVFRRDNLPAGENAFIHSAQKHVREFHSLCSMDGEQFHRIVRSEEH